MTNINPAPITSVEDNPVKPYKAIAALLAPAVLAGIQSLISNGNRHGHHLPVWAWLLLSSVAAGVATFTVKNPKRRVKGRHEAGFAQSSVGLIVGGLVLVLVSFLIVGGLHALLFWVGVVLVIVGAVLLLV